MTTVATEQSPGLVTAHGSIETFCPSRGASRDHRGSAIAEARRSSASSCLSRSARVMSRMGQFGDGLSSRGLEYTRKYPHTGTNGAYFSLCSLSPHPLCFLLPASAAFSCLLFPVSSSSHHTTNQTKHEQQQQRQQQQQQQQHSNSHHNRNNRHEVVFVWCVVWCVEQKFRGVTC